MTRCGLRATDTVTKNTETLTLEGLKLALVVLIKQAITGGM